MKKKNKKLNTIVVISIILVSAVLTQILFSTFAATGSLSLHANKQQVRRGEDVIITLRAAIDGPLTLADARITYDQAKLQYRSINYSGSPLKEDSPYASIQPGSVTVSRYVLHEDVNNFPSGDVLVANITFRALQDSGTTNVDISQADSMLYSGPGEKSLNSVSGTSVTLTSAPVVQNPQPNNPPPPSSGGSSSSSGGSGGSSSSGSVSNRSSGGGVESGSSNVQGQPAAPGRFESFAAPTPSTELNLPEPGSSRLATEQPLLTRVLKSVRSATPLLITLIAVSILGFVGYEYYRRHAIKPFTPNTSTSINSGPAGPGSGVLIGKDNNKRNL